MNDGEREYVFNLANMTVGDVIFLWSIRANMEIDEAFGRRAFELLDHVLLDADTIPVSELPNVIAQFNALLFDYTKNLNVSRFIDNLERGESSDDPERE